MKVNKARKQLSIWLTTDEILTQLSDAAEASKAEIVHIAITEMAKKYMEQDLEETE
jgi:hypothetical protein